MKKEMYLLDYKVFFRALSYRDFLTSFSLALLLVAIRSILSYYSSEPWLENWYILFRLTYFIFIPLNHLLYKIEHKRSNNFVGRVAHDLIFIGMFLILDRSYVFLRSSDTYSFNFDLDLFGTVFFVIGMIIFAALFEVVIAILKRILNLFNWQVF